MSLYSESVGSKAEMQAIKDNLERLRRISESSDFGTATVKASRTVKSRKAIKPHRCNSSADRALRQANATYREYDRKRSIQGRKRRLSW